MVKSAYSSLHELYVATLGDVYHNYEFLSSPRGQAEREVIGYSARLTNPDARYCFTPERGQNVIFNYAEALWYLSGKNDLEFIEYFAPSMKRYSADGETLQGTGYGARLFKPMQNGQTALERIVNLLSADDPASKRAVLQVFDDSEDLHSANIDVSCTLGLQCLARNGKLHMVGYMRANDAYLGLLNDIFSFTFIQELLSRILKLDLGAYIHHVGSLHIYEKNLESAERVITSDGPPVGRVRYPRMPEDASFDDVRDVLEWETRIRHDDVSLDAIRKYSLHPYWIEILTLFWIYRQITMSRPVNLDVVRGLAPVHQRLVLRRWAKAFV